MGLVDLWNNFVKPYANRLSYLRIPDYMVVDDHLDGSPLTADSGYFQVFAYSIHLAREREFLSYYVPTVASIVTETSANETREHVRVAGPGDLQRLEASAMGRTIVVNRPLTPMLPFRGGTVSVVAGLVAYKVKDNLPALIEVVSSVTKLAGGPAAAGTAEAIGAVAKGVGSLFTLGDKDLIVSLDHTWSGGTGDAGDGDAVALREGYWVLLNQPAGTRKDLWIKDGQLLVGPTSSQLKPLVGVDYLVLRLATASSRDDWVDFCRDELQRRDEAYEIQGDVEEADRQNKLAMAKILYSPYFTRSDKKTRLNELKAYRAPSVPVVPAHPGPTVVPSEGRTRSLAPTGGGMSLLPEADVAVNPPPTLGDDRELQELESYIWSSEA